MQKFNRIAKNQKHLTIFAVAENEWIELKIKNDKLKTKNYDEYYFNVATRRTGS